jgi:hypothetical protein
MADILQNYTDAVQMWMSRYFSPVGQYWQTGIPFGCTGSAGTYGLPMFFWKINSGTPTLLAIDDKGIGYWDLTGVIVDFIALYIGFNCVLDSVGNYEPVASGLFGTNVFQVTILDALVGPGSTLNGDSVVAIPHSGRPIVAALSLDAPSSVEDSLPAGNVWYAYRAWDATALDIVAILAGTGVSPWLVPDISVTFS